MLVLQVQGPLLEDHDPQTLPYAACILSLKRQEAVMESLAIPLPESLSPPCPYSLHGQAREFGFGENQCPNGQRPHLVFVIVLGFFF
jgi:hypothetical protein